MRNRTNGVADLIFVKKLSEGAQGPCREGAAELVRKEEKLFMQGLSEAGSVIDANGKIHIANREDEELTRENSEKMHSTSAISVNSHPKKLPTPTKQNRTDSRNYPSYIPNTVYT